MPNICFWGEGEEVSDRVMKERNGGVADELESCDITKQETRERGVALACSPPLLWQLPLHPPFPSIIDVPYTSTLSSNIILWRITLPPIPARQSDGRPC
jgi:hypothetical protein